MILEQFSEYVEMPLDILTLIVNNFPSLYLDERYQDVCLQDELKMDIINNPRRYESVYYREKYNSDVDDSEYIEANNPHVIEYCITTAIKNNPGNGSGKTCIDITALLGKISLHNLNKNKE